MPRPPTLPEFASVITAGYPGRVEPNAGRKNTGYDDGEAPPAGEHNWLFGVISDWVEYLDEEATRLLLAALLDQQNTFTAPLEVNVTDALTAALVTRPSADDDANAGNKWKAVLGFRIGNTDGGTNANGDIYVNQYVGTQTGPGQHVITFNAVWVTASQWWIADNPLLPSFALFFLNSASSGLFLSRRPPGTGHWSSWPVGAGDLTVGGDVTAYGALTVVGAALAGSFAYVSPITRTNTPIPVTGGDGVRYDNATGDFLPSGGAPTDPREFVLRMPAGAVINGIEVAHYQNTATSNSFTLYKRVINYATPGATTVTAIGSTGTGAASSGYKKTPIATGFHTIDGTAEYMISWAPADAADRMQGMRNASWSDAGPSNV